jgi:hypothetical protein
MKKILIRLLLAVLVVAILGLVALGAFLNNIVKHGLEVAGPKLMGVELRVQDVKLSLLSGSGRVQELVVGNPKGFVSPSAIKVGSASFALSPSSLLSEKIIIKSIRVEAPEVTVEAGLNGVNLEKILASLRASAGVGTTPAPGTQAKPASSGKRLQVDEFIITGAKIHGIVTGLGQEREAQLADIRLKDLGTNSAGITGAELAIKALEVLIPAARQAAHKGTLIPGVGTTNLPGVDVPGLNDLLKKQ